jgi:hypothetical protein
MFPTQYPRKVKDEMIVFFVRPATLEGMRDQARKVARTKGTVMRYRNHFGHLLCGVLGRRKRPNKPTKGGMIPAALYGVQ